MSRERSDLEIDPDIRRASTLPGWFYSDPAWYGRTCERVFARTWHFAGDAGDVAEAGQVRPWTLLPGCLDEPLLFARDGAAVLRCLSNVCTHRANLVVSEPGRAAAGLRCRYHGRRFGLDGRFRSMPEFEDAAGFPSRDDDLAMLPLERFGPLLFTSLDPAFPFAELAAPMVERLRGLPLERLVLDPASRREYAIEASWALYCDNYVEGFHIPYVHGGLAGALDYGAYRTETFRYASLQVGEAAPGEVAFELPPAHPDHGRRIAAYYFWLFPATMLNFYPWGLSLNAVRPVGPARTAVSFASYVWDETKREQGAGKGLHAVELEDEAVVQNVQRGVRSRLYRRGRYSPAREVGVHHFHRLLAELLNGG